MVALVSKICLHKGFLYVKTWCWFANDLPPNTDPSDALLISTMFATCLTPTVNLFESTSKCPLSIWPWTNGGSSTFQLCSWPDLGSSQARLSKMYWIHLHQGDEMKSSGLFSYVTITFPLFTPVTIFLLDHLWVWSQRYKANFHVHPRPSVLIPSPLKFALPSMTFSGMWHRFSLCPHVTDLPFWKQNILTV